MASLCVLAENVGCVEGILQLQGLVAWSEGQAERTARWWLRRVAAIMAAMQKGRQPEVLGYLPPRIDVAVLVAAGPEEVTDPMPESSSIEQRCY